MLTRCFSLLLLCGLGAAAQSVIGARAGLIDYLEGSVSLDGAPIHTSNKDFPVMKEGQSVRTAQGRVEMLLNPDIFLRMGESGRLKMVTSPLADAQVKVEEGSVLVEVVEFVKGNRVRVGLGDSVTQFRDRGVYRFEGALGKLRIFGGEAEVSMAGRTVRAKRGEEVDLIHGLKLAKFDPKVQDALHQWAGLRSANLYSGNPEARRTQVRWVLLGALPGSSIGTIWNPDYGMRIPSLPALLDYQRRKTLEDLDKKRAKDVKTMLDPPAYDMSHNPKVDGVKDIGRTAY